MTNSDQEIPAWLTTSEGTCFVIQPFDKGPFDARYDQVYEPAIRTARLDPYRVDRDPNATIPIDEIASQIRGAAVCFADISEDNPNVWFELGLAIASAREVVLVSSEKRERFPFDVQHRHVIRYKTDSPKDFSTLQAEIAERLVAAVRRQRGRETIQDISPVKSTEGLTAHEQVMLVLAAQRMYTPDEAVAAYAIRSDMQASGFNDIATVLSARSLGRRGLIETTTVEDERGDAFTAYRVLEAGFEWLE